MQVGPENFLRRSNESEFRERIEEKMPKLSQGEGVLHQVLCFGIKKKGIHHRSKCSSVLFEEQQLDAGCSLSQTFTSYCYDLYNCYL